MHLINFYQLKYVWICPRVFFSTLQVALESFYRHPHHISSHSTATSTKPSAKLSKAVFRAQREQQTADTTSALAFVIRAKCAVCIYESGNKWAAALWERAEEEIKGDPVRRRVSHRQSVGAESPSAAESSIWCNTSISLSPCRLALIITICPSQLFAPRMPAVLCALELLLIKSPHAAAWLVCEWVSGQLWCSP